MSTATIQGLIAKGGSAIGNVDQDMKIYGLYHLYSAVTPVNLSVAILGVDLGDFLLASDGSVTVSLVATAGQGAAKSAAQLIAADGDYGESNVVCSVKNGGAAVQTTVPIVVGLPFVAQGQRLRAIAADDTKTRSGSTLGMNRRAHQFAVLLQNCVEVAFGTKLTPSPLGDMKPAVFTDDAGTAIASGTTFSGVYHDTLNDDYTYDSMFCWVTVRPYPCTIVSATSFIETTER